MNHSKESLAEFFLLQYVEILHSYFCHKSLILYCCRTMWRQALTHSKSSCAMLFRTYPLSYHNKNLFIRCSTIAVKMHCICIVLTDVNFLGSPLWWQKVGYKYINKQGFSCNILFCLMNFDYSCLYKIFFKIHAPLQGGLFRQMFSNMQCIGVRYEITRYHS